MPTTLPEPKRPSVPDTPPKDPERDVPPGRTDPDVIDPKPTGESGLPPWLPDDVPPMPVPGVVI